MGKTTGWIGYTLSWTNRQFDSINFGQTYPYRYDRRHDIGIALTHEFNENVNFGRVWVYGTGNAVTLGLESYSSFHSSMVENMNSFMDRMCSREHVCFTEHVNSQMENVNSSPGEDIFY